MKKNYLHFIPMLALSVLWMASALGQQSVLFIGAGATETEYNSDKFLKDSIASWGYTVEYMDDNTFTTTAPTWANYLGVFINETVGSGNIKEFGSIRDNYPVPCVALEGYAPNSDRWGWLAAASDYMESANGTADELVFVVHNNTHYILRPYTVGEEITWSSNANESDIASIKLRAIKEANVTYTYKLGKDKALDAEADYWGMVAIDSSESIPNRVVWWGLNQWGLNGSENTNHYGTNELFAVLKRACDWTYQGLEKGVSGLHGDALLSSTLTVFPNPATDRVTLDFDLDNPSGAQVSLLTLTGQELYTLPADRILRGHNSLSLDVSPYAAGVYFIRVTSGDQAGYSKLVIQ